MTLKAIDALEKLYRAETEGTDKAACFLAWVEAMDTAEATLRASGKSVTAFADCWSDDEPETPSERNPHP